MRKRLAGSGSGFGPSLTVLAMVLALAGCKPQPKAETPEASAEASVSCPVQAAEGDFVIVTFGQSNATNFGGITWSDPFWGNDHYRAKGEVYVLDWRNGRCALANDPLPGGDGKGSSIWGRLGDELIARKLARRVIVVAFGQGATTIADWVDARPEKVTGEVLGARIDKVAQALKTAGYHPSFVAFQQGESDNKTAYADYRPRLETLGGRVRAAFGQPLHAAISTLCRAAPNAEVQRALRDAAGAGVIQLGPDFDTALTHTLDRMDRCHLSGQGLEKAARLWADMIEQR